MNAETFQSIMVLNSGLGAASHSNPSYYPLLIGICVVAILLYGLYTFLLQKSERGSVKGNDTYLRGSRLISAKDLQKAILFDSKEFAREIKADTGSVPSLDDMKGVPFDCSAHPFKVSLWEYILFRHVAFVGVSGAGKSTQLKCFLERARTAGEKCIVLDINGELYSELGKKDDHILSLYDKRSELWDPYREAHGGEKISTEQLAEYLVPSGSEADKFWWKGGRIVLKQILDSCSTIDELRDLVTGGSVDILSSLNATGKAITGESKSNQSAGIIAHALMELGFLGHLNHWARKAGKTNPFSIYNWTQNDDPNWIFIPVKDDDLEAMSPLLKLWFNIAIMGCFARNPAEKHITINMIIDEVSSFGKIESLGKSLDRLRKYRGRVFLAYHSDNHFKQRYGHEESSAILGQIQTKFIFRIREPKHAQDLSELLGNCEVLRRNKSTQRGSANGSGGNSYSESVVEKKVVLYSELQTLRDGWFYLSSLNFMPSKLRVRHKRWPQIHKLHREEREVPSKDGIVKNEESIEKFGLVISNAINELNSTI